ncbi:MAG: threonine--tRNA ligase [Deltaproteobacteria bacterium]
MAEKSAQQEERVLVQANAGETPREAFVRSGRKSKAISKAVGVRAGEQLFDLLTPLPEACEIECVAISSPDGLEFLRHSTAHLMAQATKKLYPSAQVTIGPVIEDGFYYDFAFERPFTPDDLEAIEAEMKQLAKANLTIERRVEDRADAIARFRAMGEDYKVEIIEDLPVDEPISLYQQGDFVDLCRGPHVPSTGRLAAFKLTHVAGAYWRGDEKNAMLQRIYGTAFADKKELKAHLERLEEAKKRDHRKLGPALDLFSLHPIAPGLPFFHPRGTIVYNTLVEYMRDLYKRYGYQEVITPLLYKTELFKTSGHYDSYRDDMFLLEADGDEYGVKPMNCPGHVYLFGQGKKSYRDLPIRMADFSRLHRLERSGVLAGLTRVRGFSQDDAHIFCTPEQLDDEFAAFLKMTGEVYADFGFNDVEVAIETRPEKFLGEIELWDQAEKSLAEGLIRAGFSFTVKPGDGAFYGPKVVFDFRDVLKRTWTLSTIQLDCAMPDRFGIKYTRSDGTEGRPMMLHRAVLGSLERFIAILIEHTAGALPLWLAPEQVRVLSITERVADYGRQVVETLEARGIRASLDDRNERLGFKVREAQVGKIPVLAIVGDQEAEARAVAPRFRGEKNRPAEPLEQFVESLVGMAEMPSRRGTPSQSQ